MTYLMPFLLKFLQKKKKQLCLCTYKTLQPHLVFPLFRKQLLIQGPPGSVGLVEGTLIISKKQCRGRIWRTWHILVRLNWLSGIVRLFCGELLWDLEHGLANYAMYGKSGQGLFWPRPALRMVLIFFSGWKTKQYVIEAVSGPKSLKYLPFGS